MMSNLRATVLALAASLGIAVYAVYLLHASRRTQDQAEAQAQAVTTGSHGATTHDHGIPPPWANAAPASPDGSATTGNPGSSSPLQAGGAGGDAGLDPHQNAHVASVSAAITAHLGSHLSTLLTPPPFDPASVARDPEAYLHDVIPARAFQTAAPGRNVPVLVPVGPTHLVLAHGQVAYLRVKTQPGQVGTFSSMHLGSFDDALPSQTVIADAQGIGSVGFHAGPGTVDAVHILVGSPCASGQVVFFVSIAPDADRSHT
jgi:hypothetical protein